MNQSVKKLAIRISLLAGMVLPAVAMAHEVPCPFCGMKVVQATKTQDNEVVLRFGKKKIEYRCVYCALADAGKYDGDLVVYAPSETKGKPVLLTRTSGRWAVVKEEEGKLAPEEGVVFLNSFTDHTQCATMSRAFHSKDGLNRYVKNDPKAKALSLDEMLVAVAKK